MEGFADEAFGDLGAVGVGGVDEGDAEFDGAAENAAGFFWIARLAPGAIADETHGSIAEAVDGEIAADLEGAAGGGGGSGHMPMMLNGRDGGLRLVATRMMTSLRG